MRNVLLMLAAMIAVGCEGKSRKEPGTGTTAPPPTAATTAAPVEVEADARTAAPPPLKAREGGPSLETCARAADHLKQVLLTIDPGSTEAQLEYGRKVLEANRERMMRYCLEVAVVEEIECILAAKEASGVVGCERMRQTVDERLATAKELTEADCARFFDRLRQFKVSEGVRPEEIDRDRDQIIRACQEKARPGTVACFIAAPTYEQARRCP
jgi:hypothetical protein